MDRLSEIRKRSQMTQLDLAEKADVSQGLISRLESGYTGSALKTILKVADALKVSPAEFFAPAIQPGGPSSALETYRGIVTQADCDHLGHMNLGRYVALCGDGVFALQAEAGLDRADIEGGRRLSLVAVRSEGDYRAELRPGEVIRLTSGVTGFGTKTVRLLHRLHTGAGKLAYEGRFTCVLMDLATRRGVPVPDDIRSALSRFLVEDQGAPAHETKGTTS